MPENLLDLFSIPPESILTSTFYDPWLVTLSISIAIFASFMGFQVAEQAIKTQSNRRKQISISVGSIALGGGVWSMHFIGMLALDLCSIVSYDFGITAASVLPAIAASWVALNLLIKKDIHAKELAIAGTLVGAGIGTMHYSGMAAMEMAPLLRYDLAMFSVSILVAVILAIISLWISFGLDRFFKRKKYCYLKTIISSCVMGAAISGMHYTGMAAARFVKPAGLEISKQTESFSTYLAVGVTLLTLIIIALVLASNLVFKYKDISARALKSEKRIKAIMDTAVDGIITINDRGIIVSVNTAVTRLLEWHVDELIGNNVSMIMPESFRAEHNDYIAHFIETRQPKIIGTGRDVEAMTKSGEKIPVRLGLGHVELNNQHMFVGFISDLRERIKMEAALKESEVKIWSLVSNIPGIAYRCMDAPGWPNLFISDEVENITGYPAKDFLLPQPKRSIGELVHPDDMQLIANADLRAPNGFKLEFRLIDKHGTTKWLMGHGRAIPADDKGNYYLDGFIMDISERKKMESELIAEKERAEQAAESRASFMANMSHEIRTPMNAIIGFSDVLLDEQLEGPQRKHIATINQSAKSLLHILNDILDSAKLEKGKVQLEYRTFSLVEEIDAVVSTFWLQAKDKGLALTLNIDKSVQKHYWGAPERIRQVLTNLVGNAVKFTERGEVSISVTSLENDHIRFSIKDSGIGMTKEQVNDVFDAFAQADESMSRRFGGTGLGTTISKQLVELMGGQITASSQIGQGSEFIFIIPLTAQTHTQPEVNSTRHLEIHDLNILLVDDIDQNIELMSVILKRNGHTIFEARNGQEALSMLEQHPIDLVFMDIQMPIMDGLTATKLRRQQEHENGWPRTPIIALTASVLLQDQISAEQAGIDGFANKPVDIQQLTTEMAKALNLQIEESAQPTDSTQPLLQIDTDKGAQLWGSKHAHKAEISKFLNNSQTELVDIRLSVEQKDWHKISLIAHKYKGLTGNLALNYLMSLFSQLDTFCDTQDASQALKILSEIERSLSILEEGLETSPQALSGKQVSHESCNQETLVDILTALEHSLSNNEYNEKALDQLAMITGQHQESLADIIRAYNDFDFASALIKVQNLLAKLVP